MWLGIQPGYQGDQALAQIAQRGCGVPILDDVQKLSVHSLGQPGPGDSA